MFGKNIKLKSSVEKSSTLVNGRVPPPSLMVLKRLALFFIFLATGTKAVDTLFFFC